MQRLLFVLLAGAALMGGTTYLLYPGLGNDRLVHYQFMHCPNCNMELRYNQEQAGGPCPKCRSESGPPPRLEPTEESIKVSAVPPDRLFNIVFSCEAVGLLGLVVYMLYNPPKANKDVFMHTKCKGCRQKLRYPKRLKGGKGICPRCRREVFYVDDDA